MKVKISELKPHEFNKTVFNDLEGSEFEALKNDIEKRGIQTVIDITEDNKIICGHQRIRACKELGIEEAEARVVKGSEDEIKEHLIKDNILRRQLNDYQIGQAGMELEGIYGRKAEERQKAGTLASDDAKGKTTVKVAGDFGISGATYERIKKVRDDINILHNPEIEEKWKAGEVKANNILGEIRRTELNQTESPDWFRMTTNWSFKKGEIEYDGLSNLPSQIVKNLLFYYTKEKDTVLDVFGGLGLVNNVCKDMDRKCITTDVNPREEFIIKNDIRKEIPDIDKVDFIFLDPPYWNMQDYKDELSNNSLEDFYKDFEKVIKNCKKLLKEGGKIALIIMNLSEDTKVPEGMNYVDLGFGCYDVLNRHFKPVQRISVPMYKKFEPIRIERCKRDKRFLGSLRDLMIFEAINDTNKDNTKSKP